MRGWGLGDLGSWLWVPGAGVAGLGFGVLGLRIGVDAFSFWVFDLGFIILGLGFGVDAFSFYQDLRLMLSQVLGLGFGVDAFSFPSSSRESEENSYSSNDIFAAWFWVWGFGFFGS